MLALMIALYSQELTKDTQKKMLLGIISILILHPTITNGKWLPSASLNFRISFIFFFCHLFFFPDYSNQLLVLRLITLTDNARNFDFVNLLDNIKNAADYDNVSLDRRLV